MKHAYILHSDIITCSLQIQTFLVQCRSNILVQCRSNMYFDLQSPESDRPAILSSSPALDLNLSDIGGSVPTFHRSSSLNDFGTWGKQFIQMGLPSFRPSYLFLLHVFLDVIHEALRLRLDQRPVIDPSYLSIRPVSIHTSIFCNDSVYFVYWYLVCKTCTKII